MHTQDFLSKSALPRRTVAGIAGALTLAATAAATLPLSPAPLRLADGVVVRLARPAPADARFVGTADRIRVHYRGRLADGQEFDSSYRRGRPAVLALSEVLPCWDIGLRQVPVGGRATIECPSQTAYGADGDGDIPPHAALNFEVELLDVLR